MFVDLKTIILGILTISLAQLIIKMVIEPVHEFKKIISELQFLILETTPQYKGHLKEENAVELRKVSIKLLAEMNSISMYPLIALLFNLPRKKHIIKAGRYILGLSYVLTEPALIVANQNRVKTICKLTKIYNSWDMNLDLLNIDSEF